MKNVNISLMILLHIKGNGYMFSLIMFQFQNLNIHISHIYRIYSYKHKLTKLELAEPMLLTDFGNGTKLKDKKGLFLILAQIFKKYYNGQSFKSKITPFELYEFLNKRKDNFGFPFKTPNQFLFFALKRMDVELKRITKQMKRKSPNLKNVQLKKRVNRLFI